MQDAKMYLYRSAAGTVFMLIMFGKTIFDLLFPQISSRKLTALNTVFLALYAMAIAAGIIFMASRMITLYLRSTKSGLVF
jgi:hypothetical protein